MRPKPRLCWMASLSFPCNLDLSEYSGRRRVLKQVCAEGSRSESPVLRVTIKEFKRVRPPNGARADPVTKARNSDCSSCLVQLWAYPKAKWFVLICSYILRHKYKWFEDQKCRTDHYRRPRRTIHRDGNRKWLNHWKLTRIPIGKRQIVLEPTV